MRYLLVLFLAIFLIGIVSASCESGYQFILNNNWNYTDKDLIDNNLTQEFINNFTNECGFSLPKKPLPIITIYKEPECNLEINSFFNQDIPFFDIYLGEVSCEKAKKLNYIFTLEETKSYSIKGIRIWILFPTLIILFLMGNFGLNRLLRKDLNKQNNSFISQAK